MPPSPERLALYANVVAEISVGRDEAELLQTLGLDADSYAALEREVEGALSEAMDVPGEAPPPFLVAYEKALREAQHQARRNEPSLSVATLQKALAALQSGDDPVKALEALGLKPAEVIRGVLEHGPKLATDPALMQTLLGRRQ